MLLIFTLIFKKNKIIHIFLFIIYFFFAIFLQDALKLNFFIFEYTLLLFLFSCFADELLFLHEETFELKVSVVIDELLFIFLINNISFSNSLFLFLK